MKTFKGQSDELIDRIKFNRDNIKENIAVELNKQTIRNKIFQIKTLIRAGEYFLDKCKKVNEASNYIGFLEDEYIEINTSITKLKEAIK